MTDFSHWEDPLCLKLAETVAREDHYESPVSGEHVVKFWPGLEARKFIAMMKAYEEAKK